MLPLHHIQRAIHAFFTEVNEQSLHLLMRDPEQQAEAQRIVRQSNKLLRQYIGRLKGSSWDGPDAEAQLKSLCREAESESLALMERVQKAYAATQAASPTRED